MAHSIPRIAYSMPSPDRPRRASAEAGAELAALRACVATQGIPHTQGASNPKADAIGLLMLAAEIEHALMVQYLYTAFSLRDAPRDKLVRVAVQEMMHLLAVQNLLMLLDGPAAVHLGRDRVRVASEHNPMPLVLSACSPELLARYVVAEMPASVADPALRARLDGVIAVAGGPAGVQPHRVGAIYAALLWIFQADDTPQAPLHLGVDDGYSAGWHLQPSDLQDAALVTRHAATRSEWRATNTGYVLDVVTDLARARALIDEITEQGEGLHAEHDSHFWEFLEMYDEAGQHPVAQLPTNPVGRHPGPSDAGVTLPVTDAWALAWTELFDVRYNMVLLDIAHALELPVEHESRELLCRLAFKGMHVLARLAERFAEPPLLGVAGPTFGLLHDGAPPPGGAWERHREYLRRDRELLVQLRGFPQFVEDEVIVELERLDNRRERLISPSE